MTLTRRGIGGDSAQLTTLLGVLLLVSVGLGCGEDPSGKHGETEKMRFRVPSTDNPLADAPDTPGHGRWNRFRTHQFDEGLDAEQREIIRQLESLGYAGGVVSAPDRVGVVRHDADRAFAGLNLYSSGHRPEAFLIDMLGNVLHSWHYPFEAIWPGYPRDRFRRDTFWRRVHLLENGDLLAIFEGLGIIKIDRDSNLLWASTVRAHHDLAVGPGGVIYVLSREAHLVPRINPKVPILEDFISTLDEDGVETSRISLLKAFERSDYRYIVDESRRREGDIFHTNSLELLDGRGADFAPQFRAGNFLVSMLWLNTVAVVDPWAGKVVWAQRGPYAAQHDPTLLESGRILVFNNRAGPMRSSVLEFEPLSGRVVWSYEGASGQPFYSGTCGTAQRLPNGNTLITESDGGRAFEVSGGKEIVWEFYNPHRAGDQGQYIATLMEVIRIPDGEAPEWVEHPRDH